MEFFILSFVSIRYPRFVSWFLPQTSFCFVNCEAFQYFFDYVIVYLVSWVKFRDRNRGSRLHMYDSSVDLNKISHVLCMALCNKPIIVVSTVFSMIQYTSFPRWKTCIFCAIVTGKDNCKIKRIIVNYTNGPWVWVSLSANVLQKEMKELWEENTTCMHMPFSYCKKWKEMWED